MLTATQTCGSKPPYSLHQEKRGIIHKRSSYRYLFIEISRWFLKNNLLIDKDRFALYSAFQIGKGGVFAPTQGFHPCTP